MLQSLKNWRSFPWSGSLHSADNFCIHVLVLFTAAWFCILLSLLLYYPKKAKCELSFPFFFFKVILEIVFLLVGQDVLLQFRAGKMRMEGTRVVPDSRKGLVCIGRV